MSPLDIDRGRPPPVTGRRKRPHVPEESRKRVARACDACRRLKEKCDGGFPCTRCTRLNRTCKLVDTPSIARPGSPGHDGSTEFFDPERIGALEEIIKHHVDPEALDKATLVKIAGALRNQLNPPAVRRSSELSSGHAKSPDMEDDFAIDPVSSTTAIYTGELSHCHFSNSVQRKINESLQRSESKHGNPRVLSDADLNRSSLLKSMPSAVVNATDSLPPPAVATFLIDIFFGYGQTNYFYVDEQSLRQKLDGFFSQRHALSSQDAAWVCTVLMVLAIGTQFAHLSSRDGRTDVLGAHLGLPEATPSPDDDAALTFYNAAVPLIPDVISLASIESVQAFLLLGVYTLPVDAPGLSFTYLGIAIKMAIQNGMHRKFSRGLDPRTIELRNRIWWTTYTLETRVCVSHGRPVSISKSEVDADQPSELAGLRVIDRVDTLPNILAMIRLTSYLEDARDKISCLRKTPSNSRGTALTSILRLKQDLVKYWAALPTITHCRDLAPDVPLFRSNVHLALTYHLVHTFIGRIFLFTSSPSSDQNMLPVYDMTASLVSGCVQSGLDILELCQTLQDEVGLARASYTEYTSCRAALLVILAQRIHQQSARLARASEQGIKLLKHMSVGFYADHTDKPAIEAMEMAVRRLDSGDGKQRSKEIDDAGGAPLLYDQFRTWASLWKNGGGEPTDPAQLSSDTLHTEGSASLETPSFSSFDLMQDLHWDMYSLPPEIGDFAFMPDDYSQ